MLLRTSRRTFVKGLGAASVLFGPFLRSLSAAESKPCRFVFFLEGNGTEPASFLYRRGANQAQGLTANDKTVTLASIEAQGATNVFNARSYKHTTPLTVPDANLAQARALEALAGSSGQIDLASRAAVVLGLSSKVTGGSHTTYHGALSASKSAGAVPSSETIDHTLSTYSSVVRASPFDVLRVGSSGPRVSYDSCALGPRKPAAISIDPTLTFNMLFGSVASGAGAQRFTRSGDLLDFAQTEARATLDAFSGNSLERAKLEAYMLSLEGMVARRQTIVSMESALRAAMPIEPEADVARYTSSDPLVRLAVQVDTATAALIGGLTNIAVVSCGSGGAWPESFPSLLALYPNGQMMGGHDLRHAAGGQGLGTSAREVLHEATHLRVAEMARMARALAAVPEPNADGSMLDYTIFVYLPDNGEQHHSNAEEWATLLVGGQKLGFATDGRSVVYPRVNTSGNRQMSNLFNTLGHAAGADLNDFGGEASGRIAEGPLSEIWQPV